MVSENGIVQILKLLHGRIDNGDILHLITFRVLVKERNSAICAFKFPCPGKSILQVMIKKVLGVFCVSLALSRICSAVSFSRKSLSHTLKRLTKALRSFSHCSSVRKMLRRAFRAGLRLEYPSMIFSRKAKPPNFFEFVYCRCR